MLYPVMNLSRTALELSGIWKFKCITELEVNESYTGPWPGDYELMAVPAAYNDQKTEEKIRDHYGYVLYQREFSVPAAVASQRLVLRFGSVTHHAIVYLNGSKLGTHKGGFLPFEFEISGEELKESNVLTVAVDNRVDYSTLPVGGNASGGIFGGMFPSALDIGHKVKNNPNFDFFNYAGIMRPVVLYTTPEDYIKDITVTYEVNGNKALLTVVTEYTGNEDVFVTVMDEMQTVAGRGEGTLAEIEIDNVHLWEPLKAYLYQVAVKAGKDSYSLPVGIRTVKVKGTSFLINDKPFYFKGYGKHEDSEFRGRGLDQVLNVKDIGLMKWQGANSFRTSHYPYSEEMMRLCDREGIVVIDEVPAVGVNLNFGSAKGKEPVDTFKVLKTHEHHHDVIQDLIKRDKNYACVVMWSVGNESDTATFPDSACEYYEPLIELARESDPQHRPVTLVGLMGSDYKTEKALLLADVVCLNRYYGWYLYGGELDLAKKALEIEMQYWETTGKPVMFTEYGADTMIGVTSAVPVMFSEEYQVAYYEANHEILDRYPFFIGEQVWNFADFQTEQGFNRVDGNKKGLFTRERRPKQAAHYFKERWHKIPDFYAKEKERD